MIILHLIYIISLSLYKSKVLNIDNSRYIELEKLYIGYRYREKF